MENEIEMEDASGPPSCLRLVFAAVSMVYGHGVSICDSSPAGTKTSSVLQEETSRRRGA